MRVIDDHVNYLLRSYVLVFLCIATISPVWADATQEIIDRCRRQMGQYGSAMVKGCVDQDMDAVRALSKYPKQKDMQEIIDRCKRQMGDYGWAIVKGCVDQDIEAVRALSNYPKNYSKIIARCAQQMGHYGWAMVKGCADQDIEAEKALKRY